MIMFVQSVVIDVSVLMRCPSMHVVRDGMSWLDNTILTWMVTVRATDGAQRVDETGDCMDIRACTVPAAGGQRAVAGRVRAACGLRR